MRLFADRRDAGRRLAQRLEGFSGKPNVVVLALPRGGVPVAYEVAIRLGAPLDVLVVRKLGVPGHSELALGAIASGGIRVIHHRLVQALGLSPDTVEAIEIQERAELARRERLFRADRPTLDLQGKTVIVVDDGLATGATMAAAVDALRTRDPAEILVAVPVAPPETCSALAERADAVVCLATPQAMRAIGLCYVNFTQTTDAEVRELLDAAALQRSAREPLVAPHVG